MYKRKKQSTSTISCQESSHYRQFSYLYSTTEIANRAQSPYESARSDIAKAFTPALNVKCHRFRIEICTRHFKLKI